MRLLSVAQCIESSRWKTVRPSPFFSASFNALWSSLRTVIAVWSSIPATYSITPPLVIDVEILRLDQVLNGGEVLLERRFTEDEDVMAALTLGVAFEETVVSLG
jgi:hypothetical protein